MSILNYLFIGVIFTFLIDIILNLKGIQNHPNIKKAIKNGFYWGVKERIINIFIWPVSLCIFLVSFIKQFFK